MLPLSKLLVEVFVLLLLLILNLSFTSAATVTIDLSSPNSGGSLYVYERKNTPNDDLVIINSFPTPVDEGLCAVVIYKCTVRSITMQASAKINSYCQLNISRTTVLNGGVSILGTFERNSQLHLETVNVEINDPASSMKHLVRFDPQGQNAVNQISIMYSNFTRKNFKYMISASQPQAPTCGGFTDTANPTWAAICLVPPPCNLNSGMQCTPTLDFLPWIAVVKCKFVDEVLMENDAGSTPPATMTELASIMLRPSTTAISAMTTTPSCGGKCANFDFYNNSFSQTVVAPSSFTSSSVSSFARLVFTTINNKGTTCSKFRVMRNNVTQVNAGLGARFVYFGDQNIGGTSRFAMINGFWFNENRYEAKFENNFTKFLLLSSAGQATFTTSLYAAIFGDMTTTFANKVEYFRIIDNKFTIDGISSQVLYFSRSGAAVFAGPGKITTDFTISANTIVQSSLLPPSVTNTLNNQYTIAVFYQVPIISTAFAEISGNTIDSTVFIPSFSSGTVSSPFTFTAGNPNLVRTAMTWSYSPDTENTATDAYFNIKSNTYRPVSISNSLSSGINGIIEQCLVAVSGRLTSYHQILVEKHAVEFSSVMSPGSTTSSVGTTNVGICSIEIPSAFSISSSMNLIDMKENTLKFSPSTFSASVSNNADKNRYEKVMQKSNVNILFTKGLGMIEYYPNVEKCVVHLSYEKMILTSLAQNQNTLINLQQITLGFMYSITANTGYFNYYVCQSNIMYISHKTDQDQPSTRTTSVPLQALVSIFPVYFFNDIETNINYAMNYLYVTNITIKTVFYTQNTVSQQQEWFVTEAVKGCSNTFPFALNRLSMLEVPSSISVAQSLQVVSNTVFIGLESLQPYFLSRYQAQTAADSKTDFNHDNIFSLVSFSRVSPTTTKIPRRHIQETKCGFNTFFWDASHSSGRILPYLYSTSSSLVSNTFKNNFSHSVFTTGYASYSGKLESDFFNINYNNITVWYSRSQTFVDQEDAILLATSERASSLETAQVKFPILTVMILDDPQLLASGDSGAITQIQIGDNFFNFFSQQKVFGTVRLLELANRTGTAEFDPLKFTNITGNVVFKTTDVNLMFFYTRQLEGAFKDIQINQNKIWTKIYEQESTMIATASSSSIMKTTLDIANEQVVVGLFRTEQVHYTNPARKVTLFGADSGQLIIQENKFYGDFVNLHLLDDCHFVFANLSLKGDVFIMSNEWHLGQKFASVWMTTANSNNYFYYNTKSREVIFEFTGWSFSTENPFLLQQNIFNFTFVDDMMQNLPVAMSNTRREYTPLLISSFYFLLFNHFTSEFVLTGTDGHIVVASNSMKFWKKYSTTSSPHITAVEASTFVLFSIVEQSLKVSVSNIEHFLVVMQNEVSVLVQDNAFLFESVRGLSSWHPNGFIDQESIQHKFFITQNRLGVNLTTSSLLSRQQELGTVLSLFACANGWSGTPLEISNNEMKVWSATDSKTLYQNLPVTLSAICFACGLNYNTWYTYRLNPQNQVNYKINGDPFDSLTVSQWTISQNRLYSRGEFILPPNSVSNAKLQNTRVTLFSVLPQMKDVYPNFAFSVLEISNVNMSMSGNTLIYPDDNSRNKNFVIQATAWYSNIFGAVNSTPGFSLFPMKYVDSSSMDPEATLLQLWLGFGSVGCNMVEWNNTNFVSSSSSSSTSPETFHQYTIMTRYFRRGFPSAKLNGNNRNKHELECNSFSVSLSESVSESHSIGTKSSSASHSESSTETVSTTLTHATESLSENSTFTNSFTLFTLTHTKTHSTSISAAETASVTVTLSAETISESMTDNGTFTAEPTVSPTFTVTDNNFTDTPNASFSESRSRFTETDSARTESFEIVGATLGFSPEIKNNLVTATAAVSAFASIFAVSPLAAMITSRGLAITELIGCFSRPSGKTTRWIDEAPQFPWTLLPGIRFDFYEKNSESPAENNNNKKKSAVSVYKQRPADGAYYRAAAVGWASLFVLCVCILGVIASSVMTPNKIQMMQLMKKQQDVKLLQEKQRREIEARNKASFFAAKKKGKKDKRNKLDEKLLEKVAKRDKVISEKIKTVVDPETNKKTRVIIRIKLKKKGSGKNKNNITPSVASPSSPRQNNNGDDDEENRLPEFENNNNNNNKFAPKSNSSYSLNPDSLWPFWIKIPDVLFLVCGAFLGYWCVTVGIMTTVAISGSNSISEKVGENREQDFTLDIVISVVPLGMLILIWMLCLKKVFNALRPQLPDAIVPHHHHKKPKQQLAQSPSPPQISYGSKTPRIRQQQEDDEEDEEEIFEEEEEQHYEEEKQLQQNTLRETKIHNNNNNNDLDVKFLDFVSCPCEYHLVPSFLMDQDEFNRLDGSASKNAVKTLRGEDAKKQLAALRFLQSDLGRRLFIGNVTWVRREFAQQPQEGEKVDKNKNSKKQTKKRRQQQLQKNQAPPKFSSASLLDYLHTYVRFLNGPLQHVTIFDEGKMSYDFKRRITPVFAFIEIFVTIVVCLLQGVSLGMNNEQTICRASMWTTAILNFITCLLAIWLRPFIVDFGNTVVILVELCTLFASVGSLAIIYIFDERTVADNSPSSTLAGAIQIALSAGPLLAFLIGVVMFAVRQFYLKRARVVVVGADLYWKRFDEENGIKNRNQPSSSLLGDNNKSWDDDDKFDDAQMMELICGGGVTNRNFAAGGRQSQSTSEFGGKNSNKNKNGAPNDDDEEEDNVELLIRELYNKNSLPPGFSPPNRENLPAHVVQMFQPPAPYSDEDDDGQFDNLEQAKRNAVITKNQQQQQQPVQTHLELDDGEEVEFEEEEEEEEEEEDDDENVLPPPPVVQSQQPSAKLQKTEPQQQKPPVVIAVATQQRQKPPKIESSDEDEEFDEEEEEEDEEKPVKNRLSKNEKELL